MADHPHGPEPEAAKLARAAERQLAAALADPHLVPNDLQVAIGAFRVACVRLVFDEFAFAAQKEVEKELWEAHGKVMRVYRRWLHELREHSKEHVVEIRKLKKLYLGFLKESELFYRDYIRRLDCAAGGFPELHEIAQKWEREDSSDEPGLMFPEQVRDRAFLSCYQSLIYLGDLSRYRQSDVLAEVPKWEHAIGYYDLAAVFYPDSGIAWNQQAIVALADGSHLRATYCLYRSLATAYPHPGAQKNLEINHGKIIKSWERERTSIGGTRDSLRAGKGLRHWFVCLYAKCYQGVDFSARKEMENSVMTLLAGELEKPTLEGTVQKLILTAMSAEYVALQRIKNGDESVPLLTSYLYFASLNVKIFSTLLQVLQPELERLTDDAPELYATQSATLSDKITTITRRVLPGVRLYALWFGQKWGIVSGLPAHMPDLDVPGLWKAFGDMLTLMVSAFPVEQLHTADYMLDEESETVGFQPLYSEECSQIWYDDHGRRRKWSDLGVQRHHPNVEMLVRIRQILLEGLRLVADADAPLVLDGNRFVCRETPAPAEPPGSPSTNHADAGLAEQATANGSPMAPPKHLPNHEDDHVPLYRPASESGSSAVNGDPAMNRMVDDLLKDEDALDPLPEEDENVPPTPPEQTFEDTAVLHNGQFGQGTPPVTASDLAKAMYRKSLPSPHVAPPPQHHRLSSVATPTAPPGLSPTHHAFHPPQQPPHAARQPYSPSSPAYPPGLGLHSHGSPITPSQQQQPPPHLRHSRGPSLASNRSASDAFIDATWPAPYSVTPLRDVAPPPGFGASEWTNHHHHHHHQHSSSGGGPAGYAGARTGSSALAASPLLYGVNGGVWGSAAGSGSGSEVRWTPPNGQGG